MTHTELMEYMPRLQMEFNRGTRTFTREDRQDAFQDVLVDIFIRSLCIDHLEVHVDDFLRTYKQLCAWFQRCVVMRCFKMQRSRASKKTDDEGDVHWFDRFVTDTSSDPSALMSRIADTHTYALDPSILAEQADEEREAMYVRSLLTPEELRIYQLREADATTREIAQLTEIPQTTIRRRLRMIEKKLS